MLLGRMFNPDVTIRQRVIQGINGGISALLGAPLHLVHVVEFPKCGGSWIRNMIRTYLGVPRFDQDRILRARDVILVHRLYKRSYRRPVIIVRDPRDVYVSFYYFETSISRPPKWAGSDGHFRHVPERPLKEDFKEYLTAKLLFPSHPWFYFSQFLDSWLGRPGICLIRYEDCLDDPEAQLTRICRFLGEGIELERISRAVEATSFNKITEERYGSAREPGQADNTKFHRKGVAGDWKNHFDEQACEIFQKCEGSSLMRLGYERDREWIDRYLSRGETKAAPLKAQQ